MLLAEGLEKPRRTKMKHYQVKICQTTFDGPSCQAQGFFCAPTQKRRSLEIPETQIIFQNSDIFFQNSDKKMSKLRFYDILIVYQ